MSKATAAMENGKTRRLVRSALALLAFVLVVVFVLVKTVDRWTWKAITHPQLARVVREQSAKADGIIGAIEQNRNLALPAAFWAARSAGPWQAETVAALASVSPDSAKQFSGLYPVPLSPTGSVYKIDRNAESFVNSTDSLLWKQRQSLQDLLN